ncbi:MAG TPA: HD domain-containing protein [Conexivisphaerales archaeon]|nr:HD domain-containing protein [Conexivisphaerales archaeon]
MSEDIRGMLRTLEACSGAKRVERKGWRAGAEIRDPESVADHMYATALAAMMAGDLFDLDAEKMVRMALLHDVCEVITGDIQPGEMEASKKSRLESRALAKLLRPLPARIRKKYLAAFEEFNRGSSREARLVRDLDKLEMVVQAAEYEKEGVNSKLLQDFWATAEDRVKTKEGKEMLSSAASLRPRRPSP